MNEPASAPDRPTTTTARLSPRRRTATTAGPQELPSWATATTHRLGSMLIALATVVLGAIAPGAVSSIHGLRRTAMTTYLVGCSLLVLGAVQVTPDDVGLAAVLLPVAVLAIVLAIGCHLRLRRLGSELVRPEA